MSIRKALIGAIFGLIIGTSFHIYYVAPTIPGVTGFLESAILTVAAILLGFYTGYKWEDYARK